MDVVIRMTIDVEILQGDQGELTGVPSVMQSLSSKLKEVSTLGTVKSMEIEVVTP